MGAGKEVLYFIFTHLVKLVWTLLVLMASVTNGQDYGSSVGGQEVTLPSRGTIWLSCVTHAC